ncbi:MAG: hypothetical protein M1511_09700 [Deltaproteobacteria bacterium]|nr:hypothetical protein [Deltaproteobacteria bacterium]
MLDLQVLILTLMPLFSGVTPQEAPGHSPATNLVGISEPLSPDFIVGRWKMVDQFSKWGVTDKEKARVSRIDRGQAVLEINRDGTFTMSHLFRPSKGRWEVNEKGLLIYDPEATELGTQFIPIRKRDDNRIWLLLPFSHGSVGIGMVRENPAPDTGASPK